MPPAKVSTPRGAQLNRYRKSLGTAVSPPQYDVKSTVTGPSPTAARARVTSECASAWSMPGS